MTNDSVISANDGFAIPFSSAYIRQRSPAAAAAADDDDDDDVDGGHIIIDDSEESSVYDDSDQEREVQMRRDERRGAQRENERVDGRLWDYNEKRQARESDRWRRLQEADERLAARYEKGLWASVGIEPKTERVLFGGEDDYRKTSSDQDESEEGSEEDQQDGEIASEDEEPQEDEDNV